MLNIHHTQTVISLRIFLILRFVRYHNASAATAAAAAATEQFPGSTMRTVAVGAVVNGNEEERGRGRAKERKNKSYDNCMQKNNDDDINWRCNETRVCL